MEQGQGTVSLSYHHQSDNKETMKRFKYPIRKHEEIHTTSNWHSSAQHSDSAEFCSYSFANKILPTQPRLLAKIRARTQRNYFYLQCNVLVYARL